jgi:outer membrane protein TolC
MSSLLIRVLLIKRLTAQHSFKFALSSTLLLISIRSAAPQQLSPLQTPTPTPAPTITSPPNTTQGNNLLTMDEALRLASAQASAFQQAALNERIAGEDVKQARAAFLPKVASPWAYIYTSPLISPPPGTPRTQSFIANNAIGEYEGLANVSGEIDTAGKLRATLEKNRALLGAAHAGTEIARRALAQATIEAYYGLSLAVAQRVSAEQNLSASEDFERITSLLLSGGEVAPVDLTRAQLQTNTRRDELERARANESVAADSLRVLVGYDFDKAITVSDLGTIVPVDGETSRFTVDMISHRPEFVQFDAERRAAQQEARIARAERLPQLSYSISGGFDTDSLRSPRLKEHTGVSAAFNLTIPIFDWGASKSREKQARLRMQIADSERALGQRTFAQQFYAARTQTLSASTRIRLAAQGVTLAQNNLAASIARYRSGEAQIIEVTEAQTTLAAQRLAYYQALFDYQVGLARLRQAAGQ